MIIAKIRAFLDKHSQIENPPDIMVIGDFNFPDATIRWENPDKGVLAVQKHSFSKDKRSFEMLLDMANSTK